MRLTPGIHTAPRTAAARRTRRAAAAQALAAAVLGLAAPAAAQAPASPPFAPAQPAPLAPAQAPPAGYGAAPAPPQGDAHASALQRYAMPEQPPLPLWANPRTIEYEDGDPILDGYTLRTRPDRALLTAGLVTFGSAYAVSLLSSSVAISSGDRDSDGFGLLVIPFAGPVITMSTSDAEGGGLFMLAVDEALQIGGLLVFAAGFANETPYLLRQNTGRDRGPSQLASIRPEVSLGLSSAAVRWRF
jgi:hypothetical protein